MKSRIYLEDIKIHAKHGVLPEEALVGNQYLVNAEICADINKATETDDLNDTISYADINDVIHQEMAIRSELLEHIIGRIISRIESEFPKVTYIKIKLTKVKPPMQGEMRGVSLEFEKEILR